MRAYCFLIPIFYLLSSVFTEWQPDFETAKKLAKTEHKLILLNFSGSDWCGPCIKMKTEIFDNVDFKALADTALVLVNADFPRNKRNQPPKEQQQHNELLAERYNHEGKFPLTLLLTANGTVLKSWEGFPTGGIKAFNDALKQISDEQH